MVVTLKLYIFNVDVSTMFENIIYGKFNSIYCNRQEAL